MTMQAKKFTIVVRGADDSQLEESFDEAVRRIKAGNVTGGDHREDAGFYFNVTDDVPAADFPA